jgi:O-acetyl-ADP-ribose deacetylase (regulator of RNase III)
MRTLHGDLLALALAGRFDLIVHGCNCFHAMGAGIARSVKQHFPEAWEADLATPRGERGKLGTISHAAVLRDGHTIVVVNAYTQFHWAGAGPLADYDAIRAAFSCIRERFGSLRIGYPRIGAGLAGGDWDTIAAIIEQELAGCDHALVEYRP